MAQPSMTGWHSWVLGRKQAEDWEEREGGKKYLKRSFFHCEPWLNSVTGSVSDSLKMCLFFQTEKEWRALYRWRQWGNTCCCHGPCWLGPQWCPYAHAPRPLSPQALHTGRPPSTPYPYNLWARLAGPGKNRVVEEFNKSKKKKKQGMFGCIKRERAELWHIII